MLGIAGCGTSDSGQSVTPTPRKAAVREAATPSPTPVTYATLQPALTATPTPVALRPTATIPPRRTPTPTPLPSTAVPVVAAAGELVSAVLQPTTMLPGGSFTVTVITRGPVHAVEVDLGSGSPAGPSPRGYTLARVSPGTWGATGTAPSVPGEYHYSVHLQTAGRTLLRDNDAWNVTVAGAAPTSSPAIGLAVPPELLAPPFSYGSPQPAIFGAAGGTVSGSEVISNTRPDIAAATVATYYTTHLPRAGWALGSGGVPAGATSFSISATQGRRVCIVQYGGATVHVFYGTLS